jgi:hypothetical protein
METEKFIHDLWALPCRLDENYCSIFQSLRQKSSSSCVFIARNGATVITFNISFVMLDAMGGNSLISNEYLIFIMKSG